MRTCIRRVGESARVGRLAGKSLLRVGVPSAPCGARTLAAKAMTETAVFLEEIAVSQTPKRLQGLMRVLEAQGGSSLSPADRRGLHPLLVPLVAKGEDVTCLLRWPEPSQFKTMPLPVVRMTRGAVGMTLVARSVDEYLHRLLAEEDFVADAAAGAATLGRPLLEAAGPDAEGLFKAGDVAAAGLGGGKGGQQGLALYLIRKAGMFPDVCEQLALGHLARGDKTSAMVAAEWYMRNGHFVGWARPYEFASDLFMQLGRGEEGRDMARMGLRLPWWGLRAPFAAVATTAALPVEADRVMYLLSEEAAAAASATVNKTFQAYREPKTTKQLALERATALMNRVVAGEAGGEGGYDGIRDQLAAAYSEAGLSDVANFIQAA